jgi:hypothetical protein
VLDTSAPASKVSVRESHTLAMCDFDQREK